MNSKSKKFLVKLGIYFVAIAYLFLGSGLAQAAENVYVADFLIDQQEVSRESASSQGLFESIRPGIIKPKKDPVEDALGLAQSLSASLVAELNAKNIPTSRVSRFDQLASNGVLVQGEFLELDEGNNLKRAAIGFGSGAANMEIKVMVSRLPLGRDNSDVVFDAKSSSGKGPGGLLGIAICGNPYALAAKFVLSKRASQKDIQALALKIAKEIEDYLQKQPAIKNTII